MEVYGQLLGVPQLRLSHTRYDPPLSKATALLYYLAYKGEWVSRDELLYVFYPDTAEDAARGNLRQLLASIRRLPYSQGLIVEVSRLRWSITTDVQAFNQAMRQGQWAQAVDLYRGDLLAGVAVANMPEFEGWLELERDKMRQKWREAVLNFARQLEEVQRYRDAAELLEKLFKADPLDEEALQHYLQALHQAGHKGKALEVFERFRSQLQAEIDSVPEDATLELVKRLQQEEPSAGVQKIAVLVEPAVKQPPRHNLLVQATPFIGREVEKEKLSHLLSNPSCRLLTVVGPGGIGKTRLAIEVAREQLDIFNDGVYFVNFVPIALPELMVYAIGDAVGFSFFGQRPPKAQLLDYLKDKEILLVLDNLEHLLSGLELVSSLLEHTPHIKVLATSRERLNLHAERTFDLYGLSVPEAAEEAAQEHDAVKLFAQSASGARTDFVLDNNTLPAVVRICRLVHGMPLAIELAASWLRALTPEDIAAEIEKGMDFLEASIRDVPARHRSIRAVFDHSWKLLTEEEQAGLRKLAVFQGGFRREAAAEIVGVSLALLAALVDKSFLTLTPTGRYRRHPLVLQYTQEKLNAYPEEKAETQERHSQYYFRLAKEREKVVFTIEGRETLKALEEELPNFRAAWTYFLENQRVDEIKVYAFTLSAVFEDRVAEREQLFAQAVAALDASNPDHQLALGYVLRVRSATMVSLTRIQEATEYARQSLELLRHSGDLGEMMHGLQLLGAGLWFTGDFLQSKSKFSEALALAREHPALRSQTGWILSWLALLERELAGFSQVKQVFEESLEEAAEVSDPAASSVTMGAVAALTHEYGVYLAQYGLLEEGEKLVREGLRLIREAKDPRSECYVLLNLSLVTCRLGRYDEAEALALETLALAEKLTMKDAEARALTRLGRVAIGRGNYADAQHYLKESLRVAWTWRHMFTVLDTFILISELRLSQGQALEAALLIGLAKQQPTFLNEHRLELEPLLETLKEQLSPQELEEALERGGQMKLEGVVQELLQHLP